MNNTSSSVVTITLNPAIDQTVTIPSFTVGAVNRVVHTRTNAGGKGVNVAANLAEYGHSVAVTGFLGRENAVIFEELFRERKMADHFVRITGRTRVGIKISDPASHETTDINFAGPAPEPGDLYGLRHQLDELCSSADNTWFVLGGSVPPGVDPGIYAEFTHLLRSREKRVVLDTSGEPLRQALEAQPDVIKPNIHELEELLGARLGSREEVIQAARTLNGRGIELVVVSMGGDGALFVTRDEVVLVRPPKIAVRSTVGAGDAMVAGTVAGLLEGLPLKDCARLATAFSVAVLTAGDSDLGFRARVDAAVDQVTFETLSL